MTWSSLVSATLPGRSEDWRVVHELLQDRRGGALLVTGDAGLGKTELLDRAQDWAAAAGEPTLRTGVGEFQTLLGLEGLAPLLRPLLARATALAPHERATIDFVLGAESRPPPSTVTISNAVLSLLRSAAAVTPVLVIVDDAQWLDHTSCEILTFVARRLARSRVRLLVATRPGYSSPLESAGLPQVDLAPLDDTAARVVLFGHRPELPPARHDEILRLAAGNPLALLELSPEEHPAGLVASGHELAPDLPASVAALFGPRIATLPPLTRDVMLVASLEGTGDLGLVSLAAGEAALDHLSFAEHSALLVVDESTGALRFRHPLVPRTVVTLAEEGHRRTAHDRLARALTDFPLRRAWHLAQAADGPDEPTAALVEEQAHLAARRGDTTAAAALLRRAAQLSPGPAQRVHRQVLGALLDADVTGDLAGARDVLDHTRQHGTEASGTLATALAGTSMLLNAECEVDTARRLLVDAIRSHPGRDDAGDPVLVSALYSLLLMCWFSGRPTAWDDFRDGTARLGADVPLLMDVCQRTFGDPGHRALDALPALEDLLRRLPTERDPVAVTNLALACVYVDRLPRCRQALQRVIEDGRAGGAVALAINALVSRSVDAWQTGQWDDALAMVAEGADLARRHGYRRYSVILGGYIEQLVHVAHGDLDVGREAAAEMAEWAAGRGAGMCSIFAEHLWTLRSSARGDFETAYQHAAEIAAPGELGPHQPHALWVLLDLVEAAVATGRVEEARAHVAEMRRRRIAELSPRLCMVVAGCQALVAPPDGAAAAFEEALAVPEGPHWPFDRARIELAYGVHLQRLHDLDAARQHLRAASASLHRLGARPWQARADSALRALGVRTDGPVASPQDARLSPREQQIAELAAQGLTNRQIGEQLFLSPRSVGAALYRLFPRLGISSRAALAAALERPAPPADDGPPDAPPER